MVKTARTGRADEAEDDRATWRKRQFIGDRWIGVPEVPGHSIAWDMIGQRPPISAPDIRPIYAMRSKPRKLDELAAPTSVPNMVTTNATSVPPRKISAKPLVLNEPVRKWD